MKGRSALEGRLILGMSWEVPSASRIASSETQ